MKNNWILNCTLGIVLGIGVAGGIVATLRDLMPPDSLAMAALFLGVVALAGAVQGVVLAHFQYPRVAAAVPGLNRQAWLRNSLIAGAVLWAVSCVPLLIPDRLQYQFFEDTNTTPWFWVWLCVDGFLWLFGFGLAQWRVLATVHKKGAGAWLWANAVGWLLGTLLVFFVQGLIAMPASVWVVYGTVFAAVVAGAALVALCMQMALKVLERRGA